MKSVRCDHRIQCGWVPIKFSQSKSLTIVNVDNTSPDGRLELGTIQTRFDASFVHMDRGA